jgi:hypothetical protein
MSTRFRKRWHPSSDTGANRVACAVAVVVGLSGVLTAASAWADTLPWAKAQSGYLDCSQGNQPGCEPGGTVNGEYAPEPGYSPQFQPPTNKKPYGQQSYQTPSYKPSYKPSYRPLAPKQGGYTAPNYRPPYTPAPAVLPDQPYDGQAYDSQPYDGQDDQQPPYANQAPRRQETFSSDEITGAGHRFFGNVTKGLASVIEYAFQQQGRPNGYILGEEGGGAFVAGLRYGEGVLHTKSAGRRRVYWQGPSIGYDFGAEGSKTMILVYDMYSPDEIFYDYAGVGGQAYLVGGAGITFLKSGHVIMAPIRSGIGLRLGANVGYLKFTRQPTWNPF